MRNKKQRINLMLLAGSIFMAFSVSNNVYAMKKCVDAEGKTHYGDTAQAACNRTEVTTLNNRGFIKHDADGPKTANELALEAEAQQAEEERRRIEREEEEERIRILSVYETEDDIDRQLENQLSSVNTNIAVHKTYINKMQEQIKIIEKKKKFAKGRGIELVQEEVDAAQAKIEMSKKALVKLAKESKQVRVRFEREKELFRTLKAEMAES